MPLFVGASESYDTDAWEAYNLKKENAKLRELCKEWYSFARELFDEYIGEPEMDEEFMTLEDRLRKMGVEPY